MNDFLLFFRAVSAPQDTVGAGGTGAAAGREAAGAGTSGQDVPAAVPVPPSPAQCPRAGWHRQGRLSVRVSVSKKTTALLRRPSPRGASRCRPCSAVRAAGLHCTPSARSAGLTTPHRAGRLSVFSVYGNCSNEVYHLSYKPVPFLTPVHHGSSEDAGGGAWNQKHFPKQLLPPALVVAQSHAAVCPQHFPRCHRQQPRPPHPGHPAGAGDTQHFPRTHADIQKYGCSLEVSMVAGGVNAALV